MCIEIVCNGWADENVRTVGEEPASAVVFLLSVDSVDENEDTAVETLELLGLLKTSEVEVGIALLFVDPSVVESDVEVGDSCAGLEFEVINVLELKEGLFEVVVGEFAVEVDFDSVVAEPEVESRFVEPGFPPWPVDGTVDDSEGS